MLVSKKSDYVTIHLSSKKLDIKLSDGSDYILKEYASSKTTLKDVRKRLASAKTFIYVRRENGVKRKM